MKEFSQKKGRGGMRISECNHSNYEIMREISYQSIELIDEMNEENVPLHSNIRDIQFSN